ncbi:MAG: helix-turn-helix domain-containing protein [Chromatiaceae bacterium]
MSAPPRYRINLLANEREFLEKLIGTHGTEQQIARRARIVLLANGEAWSNQAIAEELKIYQADVSMWTQRWVERGHDPLAQRLRDRPRSGRPGTIGADAWCRVFALACESPQEHGRPITHWSSRELAAEAIGQGIVASLSAGHLRKTLKKRRCNPIAAVTG